MAWNKVKASKLKAKTTAKISKINAKGALSKSKADAKIRNAQQLGKTARAASYASAATEIAKAKYSSNNQNLDQLRQLQSLISDSEQNGSQPEQDNTLTDPYGYGSGGSRR